MSAYANLEEQAEFLAEAADWVARGVQIIGGCCGVDLAYVRPLRDSLTTHI